MALEISISLSVDVVKGNLRKSFRPALIQPTLAADASADMVQTIGTSFEDLTINSDVVAGGWAWFKNLHTTATITIASGAATSGATSFPFCQLLPGEHAITRCVTTAVCAKASAGTANLQFGMLSA